MSGGGGDRRGQSKRSQSGGIRGKNRRRKRICRARAVSSKDRTRDKLLHWKTRNSKKTHNRGLGDSLINTGWDLPIREGAELRSSRRFQLPRGSHKSSIKKCKAAFEWQWLSYQLIYCFKTWYQQSGWSSLYVSNIMIMTMTFLFIIITPNFCVMLVEVNYTKWRELSDVKWMAAYGTNGTGEFRIQAPGPGLELCQPEVLRPCRGSWKSSIKEAKLPLNDSGWAISWYTASKLDINSLDDHHYMFQT